MSHVDDGALHAYLDGELPPVERARLEAHVAECAACRTRLEQERALIERASGLLGFAGPPERAVPPLHQLRRPRLAWRLRLPLTWAATVLLALGVGYYAGDRAFVEHASPPSTLVRDSPQPAALAEAREENAQRRLAAPPPSQAAGQPPMEREPPPARQVDGNVVEASLDSVSAAAGVIAIRQAAPMPMAEPVVTTGSAAADLSAARGRLVATEWQIIRRAPARDILGADPVGIPGVAVRNIRRSPSGDVVLVEQAVDSATVIQVFQKRVEQDSDAPLAAARQRYAGTERLARFIGGLRVEIAGPLSTDSLNRLLEQVKPIP